MTSNPPQGVLRFIIGGEVQADTNFPLPTDSEIVLGRDPDCDINLDTYISVSRRHATIRPLNHQGEWVIYDLNSSNGTYINGTKLQGGQALRSGDRIRLSQNGPEFLFEYETLLPITSAPQYKHQVVTQPQTIEESTYRLQLLPRRLMIDDRRSQRDDGLFIVLVFCIIFPPLLLILLFQHIANEQLADYIFDLETNLLTIHYHSLLRRLFGKIRRSESYSLSDFIAVRLQRAEYEGDEGTRYDEYTISLEQKKGQAIKLPFTWRYYPNDDKSHDNPRKAKQVVELIEQYLSHARS